MRSKVTMTEQELRDRLDSLLEEAEANGLSEFTVAHIARQQVWKYDKRVFSK